MRFWYVVFILLAFTCISCNYFSTTQNNDVKDTIIDFTKVDISPSFDNCKNLLGKKKTNCFRTEIQQRISVDLKRHKFITENFIDEVIIVNVLINNKGYFTFLNTSSTKMLKNNFPKLDSLIKKAIKDLPQISPGIKRGIPVSTQYQLPIRILTEK